MKATDAPDTRERLLEAALGVVHTQGFHRATLADIAREAGVPKGNVHYHFPTKQTLGAAVVDRRLAHQQAAVARWDELPSPRERLAAFVQMTVDARGELAEHGCPVGSLCSELGKDGGPLADHAGGLLAAWLAWLRTQFAELGHDDPERSAGHLLAAVQGASLLAHALGDPRHVEREAEHLRQWIGVS